MKTTNFLIILIIFISCSKNPEMMSYKVIDRTFTGLFTYDMDFQGDSLVDLKFQSEIVNDFIEGHDTIAITIHPYGNTEIYDDSKHGYIPPLELGTEISSKDEWYNNICVLATFNSSGRFDGKGYKYVGFSLRDRDDYNYGWIKIYISEKNDTMKIIDFAYNTKLNERIYAGENMER